MALNLGETEALFRRVAAVYHKRQGVGCHKSGFVREHFARFLGVNGSDVSRWENGEREAGAYLPRRMVDYLTRTFGDAHEAAVVVYGPSLAGHGLTVEARPADDGDAEAAFLALPGPLADAIRGVFDSLRDGVATPEERAASMPALRQLHRALGEAVAAEAARQTTLPYLAKASA